MRINGTLYQILILNECVSDNQRDKCIGDDIGDTEADEIKHSIPCVPFWIPCEGRLKEDCLSDYQGMFELLCHHVRKARLPHHKKDNQIIVGIEYWVV